MAPIDGVFLLLEGIAAMVVCALAAAGEYQAAWIGAAVCVLILVAHGIAYRIEDRRYR